MLRLLYTLRVAIPLFVTLVPHALGSEIGVAGGRLVVAQRSSPRTFNPVFAVDEPSRAVINLISAPLIRIHPVTQVAEGVLAQSWKMSPDRREITVQLRQGLRFSDGNPVTVEDVLFTFDVHLDANTGSPLRELLIVGGQPVERSQTGPQTIHLKLSRPYAPGERLIGGFAVLPKHALEQAFRDGKLSAAWNLNAPPASVVGAGPFRLRSYAADGRIVLERNPHYSKTDASGKKLPYLDEIEIAPTGGEDAQVTRFRAGEADVIAGFGGSSYLALERAGMRPPPQLADAGPGLDYTFLVFNLNPRVGPPAWLPADGFRRAIALSIDRTAIARLVYQGRATPIAGHVTPARQQWIAQKAGALRAGALTGMTRSLDEAQSALKVAGFQRNSSGKLAGPDGKTVTMSIVVNSANPTHGQSAAIVQEDLRPLGIDVNVVSLEFRSLVDRVLTRRDFEVALMALRPGDADPMSDTNVLTSTGKTRLWNMSGKPSQPWEEEIDKLMAQQLSMISMKDRKAAFDRVQEILATHLPFITMVSPNVLAAARAGLGNFRAVVADAPALWNAEELYWRDPDRRGAAKNP